MMDYIDAVCFVCNQNSNSKIKAIDSISKKTHAGNGWTRLYFDAKADSKDVNVSAYVKHRQDDIIDVCNITILAK